MARQPSKKTGREEGKAKNATHENQGKVSTKSRSTLKTGTTTTSVVPRNGTATKKPAAAVAKKLPAEKATATAPVSKQVAEVTCGLKPSHEDIQRRAYEIYLARGATVADPRADWLQAERELSRGRALQKAREPGNR